MDVTNSLCSLVLIEGNFKHNATCVRNKLRTLWKPIWLFCDIYFSFKLSD